jgi:hypothetical protein
MTRKSALALAATVALGGLSLATDASAQHHGGGHGGGGGAHFGGAGGHFGGGGAHLGGGRIGAGRLATGRGPGAPAVAGRGPGPGGARAFVPGGHRRHFWHGRWWYYGVGPCWVWSDYYGEYVWACD